MALFVGLIPILIAEDLETFLREEPDGLVHKMLRAEDRYIFI